MSAELAARRTAAAAVLADYRAALASAPLGSPPGREWMLRLADVLGDLLDGLGLIEAKNPDSRDALRQAIGQLFDYRRFHKPPVRLAVLLPYQPNPERLDLLRSADIEALRPHGSGFRDSAHGEFT